MLLLGVQVRLPNEQNRRRALPQQVGRAEQNLQVFLQPKQRNSGTAKA